MPRKAAPAPRRSWLRDNGLTLALALLFLASLVGQALSGLATENEERLKAGLSALDLLPYLTGGQFLGALFENWESEFLQMWAFVMLTAYLFQRGSPESKDPDEKAEQDRDAANPDASGPVRADRLSRLVYAHSLGLALMGLFVVSFLLHWLNSHRHAVDQALREGQPAPALLEWLTAPGFWFESFQNWQSEFLSTAVLIVLSIYLRERGSPESKPVK